MIPEPGDDIIDSRDVIEAIKELQDALDEMKGDDLVDYVRADLDALLAFQDDAQGVPDWKYGEVFILDGHFEDYARQMAEDIGAIDREYSWPSSFIDWEAAAEALKMDYGSYTFGGYTYWARG